jgi:hypothetical protein
MVVASVSVPEESDFSPRKLKVGLWRNPRCAIALPRIRHGHRAAARRILLRPPRPLRAGVACHGRHDGGDDRALSPAGTLSLWARPDGTARGKLTASNHPRDPSLVARADRQWQYAAANAGAASRNRKHNCHNANQFRGVIHAAFGLCISTITRYPSRYESDCSTRIRDQSLIAQQAA